MKKVTIAFFLGSFLLISCKKDCAKPDDITKISATWVGKYSTTDGGTQNVDQTWEIKSNGEIIVHDGYTSPTAPDANKAKGTWTLNGTKFRATYKFLTLNLNRYIDATLSADFKTMTGNRGQDGIFTGNGNFTMTRP